MKTLLTKIDKTSQQISKKLYKRLPDTVWLLVGAIALFALITVAVYLVRAGGGAGHNWPATWNLSNSDNSVLYQFSQDIFKHRHLQWSFSPQVYVIPEIPISIVAYAVSFGNVYWYYILVALFNNVLLLLGLYAVIKYVIQSGGSTRYKDAVLKSLVAAVPPVALPLIGVNTIFAYHLAPTYYFGSYLAAITLPLAMFAEDRRIRYGFSALYILTAASNPLTLVFSIPSLLIVGVIMYLRSGLKSPVKLGVATTVLVVGSQIIRAVFFSKLVGTSPANYISIELFAKRLDGIEKLALYGFRGALDPLLVLIILASVGLGIMAALAKTRDYLKKASTSTLVLIYLLLLSPVTLLTLYCIMVVNGLYLWLVIVFPVCALLLLIPKKYDLILGVASYAAIALVCLSPKGLSNLMSLGNYFNYQTPIAQCLDAHLPDGTDVGYATFSDARISSITSHKSRLIVPILSATNPTGWLTNERYPLDYPGSYFVISPNGAETPISEKIVTANFGQPDYTFRCDGSIYVDGYTKKATLKRIDAYYDTMYSQAMEAKK